MAGPLSPPPVRDFKPGYLPAYVSNGLIGLRAGPLPLLQGVRIVSGIAGRGGRSRLIARQGAERASIERAD